MFVDGHEDARPPLASTTGEAADCELGLALRLFDGDLDPALRTVLPVVDGAHVIALGPRDADEIAEAGVMSLRSALRLLLQPDELLAPGADETVARAVSELPRLWWLHVDLDVLASEELAAVDYPQPGGLQWEQLTSLTRRMLTAPACAGFSVCIYNPDLDPESQAADRIIDYLVDTLTARVGP